MDIYLLDNQLRRTTIVDLYKSLIWTERYSEYGDFELVLHNTRNNLNLFQNGTRIRIAKSNRIMEVETVSVKEDANGAETLTVTGRSLEFVLINRCHPKWVYGPGTPSAIANAIFKDLCITGVISVDDRIPQLVEGISSPAGNIPEPTEEITMTLGPGEIYESIKQICDIYNLGFRIIRNGEDPVSLYFEVYTGDDRTSTQNLKPAVIFSKSLENLSNISSISSVVDYKNTAYVFSENGFEIVYADSTNTSMAGFERRVLLVEANDIDLVAGPELTAILRQKGREELAKNRAVIAFDGEIPQTNTYRYGVDYNLGDMVELRDTDGKINIMRVTEQIFISDEQGDRSYPTLSFDLLITPGSWASWPASQEWEDVNDMWAQV